MKKKILCLCTIFAFMILCTACGKEKNLKSVSFSDHDVYLGETKEQLKKDFGNFLSEDGNKITLLDDKKGSLTLTMMNDKVAFIDSDDKSINYNGLSIGGSIEDVSSCLGVDKNFIGNNSSVQIFYNKDNEIVYKNNKTVCSTTSPVPSEDEDYSGYTTTFFKNYAKIRKSKYMIEAYVYNGKLSSIKLLSSSAYLKLTNINTFFIDDKIYYLDTISKKDTEDLLGDYGYEDENTVFTYKNPKPDKDWDEYMVIKGTNLIGGIQFNQSDNRKYILAMKNSDVVINNLYFGEPIANAVRTLKVTQAFAEKNKNILIFYDKDGNELAKYDNAEEFFNSSESAPSETVYQLHIQFDNTKIISLSLMMY